LEIYKLKREEEKAWNAYIQNSNSSTFYHQIGWTRSWSRFRSQPYGGVCADTKFIENAHIKEAKRITKECRADYLELRTISDDNTPGLISKSL